MPQEIKILVESLLNNNINNVNSWQMNLIKNWNQIIGDLNSKVKLQKVFNDTIVLGVYDSCWMQELYVLSNILIKKINSNLDQPRIKNIRFKQIAYKKNVIKEPKNHFSFHKIELSQKELLALNKIEDPQLSDSLKNFLIRCYNVKQMK